MPAGVVNTKADERKWARAKAIVRKQYPGVKVTDDKFWALVSSVFGNMKKATRARARLRSILSMFRSTSMVVGPGTTNLSRSACAVVIPAGALPDWIELLPAGKFMAVDGRGPFVNEQPDEVVKVSLAKMPPVGLVVDYEHSTDLAAPHGRPAPAAGWLKRFRVSDSGAIFAFVEWTQEAAEAIKDKKWRYISPVFEHSKSGAVERILRAAVTNNPALVNLPALASARSTMAPKDEGEGKPVKLSEMIARLEAALPEATHEHLMRHAALAMNPDKSFRDWADEEAEEPEHQEAAPSEREEDSAAASDPYEGETAEGMAERQAGEMEQCAEGDRDAMAAEHMAQRERFAKRMASRAAAAGTNVPPPTNMSAKGSASTMRPGELNALVAKHPMVVKMAAEINEMRLAARNASATERVDEAIRGGKLIPSQRDWAIQYCTTDSVGFDKFIGAQPTIVRKGPDGTFSTPLSEHQETGISQSELAICRNLGLQFRDKDGKDVTVERFVEAKTQRMSYGAHLD